MYGRFFSARRGEKEPTKAKPLCLRTSYVLMFANDLHHSIFAGLLCRQWASGSFLSAYPRSSAFCLGPRLRKSACPCSTALWRMPCMCGIVEKYIFPSQSSRLLASIAGRLSGIKRFAILSDRGGAPGAPPAVPACWHSRCGMRTKHCHVYSRTHLIAAHPMAAPPMAAGVRSISATVSGCPRFPRPRPK